MKNLLLFFVTIFFVTYSKAQFQSKLTVNSTSISAIKIIIDGRKYYSNNNILKIKNLKPGYHNISLYYLKQKDYNKYYDFGYSNLWKKAFTKQMFIRNNYIYDITINRFGRSYFDQELIYKRNNNGWDSDDDANDEFDVNEIDVFDGFDENEDDWDIFKKQSRGDGKNYFATNNRIVLSNATFSQIKATMQNQSFDNSKLNFAKKSIKNYSINTSQVIELMNILNSETNKLDFAKAAFSNTIDKQKFFLVANSFNFQSSKDDLIEFIEKNQ